MPMSTESKLKSQAYTTACMGIRDAMNLSPEELVLADIIQDRSSRVTWPEEYKMIEAELKDASPLFRDMEKIK